MNCDRKFTQLISRTNIFITESLFNERLSVEGYSLQTLLITFRRKNLWIQVLANIPSRLIFGFAYLHYIYLISILMMQKEDKTPNKPWS